jgi:hypothetical protein
MQRPTLAVLLLAALAALAGAACAEDDPGSRAAAVVPEEQAAPPPARMQPVPSREMPGGYKGPLPPVPTSPYAAAPPDVVRAVYEFAARRPDVLRHVPCFCGCERNGHQDNEDCFVAARGPDGRPTWADHGLT